MRGDAFLLLVLAAVASWAIVRVFGYMAEHSPMRSRIVATLTFILIAIWFLAGVYGVVFVVVAALR